MTTAHSWTAHTAMYVNNLKNVLLRVKYGTEPWIDRLWRTLRQQYETADPAVMAETMQKVMTDRGSSCIYSLFSLKTNIPYVGLVETRPAMERMQEHFQNIGLPKVDEEQRYKGMRKIAGPEGWYFLPYIVCEGHLPLKQLQKIETREINSHPNSWNKKPTRKRNKVMHFGDKRLRSVTRKPPQRQAVRMESYALGPEGNKQLNCDIVQLLGTDHCLVHNSAH